ncbi:hypothetical protein ILYODFUR_022252 [Ilyodon furcidens]|uniref:Uncharacterized protein n=1 Tax=Ilyodon furcidens TaxID=33524 RepID=A0ABV0TWS3_9TELE
MWAMWGCDHCDEVQRQSSGSDHLETNDGMKHRREMVKVERASGVAALWMERGRFKKKTEEQASSATGQTKGFTRTEFLKIQKLCGFFRRFLILSPNDFYSSHPPCRQFHLIIS